MQKIEVGRFYKFLMGICVVRGIDGDTVNITWLTSDSGVTRGSMSRHLFVMFGSPIPMEDPTPKRKLTR